MEELRMGHRGKQTTDLPAMSAAAGMPSKPAEHLGLKEARAFSHQEGVVGTRVRVDSVEGTEEGGEREAFEPEEDTDTKVFQGHTRLLTTLLGALCHCLKVVPVPSAPSVSEHLTLATLSVVEVPRNCCPTRTSEWSCHTGVCGG